MRNSSTHTKILLRLKDLHIAFPKLSICHHLSLATTDFGDIFRMEDTELLESLDKYKAELEMNTVPDTELDRIIEEGKNLDTLFRADSEDEALFYGG